MDGPQKSKLSVNNISNIRRLAIFIPLKISFSFDICHQLQIVSLSKRMKFLIVFVAFFGLAFGSDLFTGSWKEDQYKRENLGDYLYERGTFLLFFHYSYMFFGGSWPSNFLTFFMNENFEILQVRKFKKYKF